MAMCPNCFKHNKSMLAEHCPDCTHRTNVGDQIEFSGIVTLIQVVFWGAILVWIFG